MVRRVQREVERARRQPEDGDGDIAERDLVRLLGQDPPRRLRVDADPAERLVELQVRAGAFVLPEPRVRSTAADLVRSEVTKPEPPQDGGRFVQAPARHEQVDVVRVTVIGRTVQPAPDRRALEDDALDARSGERSDDARGQRLVEEIGSGVANTVE